MSDTTPTPDRRTGPAGWHGRMLLARARRAPAPRLELDADDARTAGMVGIDRYRRPHPDRPPGDD